MKLPQWPQVLRHQAVIIKACSTQLMILALPINDNLLYAHTSRRFPNFN
uniref:Uncharacterized protein n=1 Tax=Alteromonadaceae bacterium PE-TB08W TaxID=1199097 RepID=A0A3G9EIW1_9ALTE|nr:hypothetical protein (truncated) [Alteromonadaceae bacterium PE-TB08W]